MRDTFQLTRKVNLRFFVTWLLKSNLYNNAFFPLVEFPKIEVDLFKLQYFVKEGDIIIDVGVNIGMFLTILSKLVKTNGRVLSFEPSSNIFYYLNKIVNGKIKKLSNVHLFQEALENQSNNASLIFTKEKYWIMIDHLTRIVGLGNINDNY